MKKLARRNKASSKKVWSWWFLEGFLWNVGHHLEVKKNNKIFSEFQTMTIFQSMEVASWPQPRTPSCSLSQCHCQATRSWSSWKWCQNPSLRSAGISWHVLWTEILNHNALSRLLQCSEGYFLLRISECDFTSLPFPRCTGGRSWRVNKLRNQSYHFDLTPAL